MNCTMLVDAVSDYAASEEMRSRRAVSWTANAVSAGGRYLVAITVDDVLVVREEDDALYRAVDRAFTSFAQWRENVEMLERSVDALRGRAAGNVNDHVAVGGGR